MDNNGDAPQPPNLGNNQVITHIPRIITPDQYQRNIQRLAEIQRMNEIGLQNYAQLEYERVQEGIQAQQRLQQLQQTLGRPLVLVPGQSQYAHANNWSSGTSQASGIPGGANSGASSYGTTTSNEFHSTSQPPFSNVTGTQPQQTASFHGTHMPSSASHAPPQPPVHQPHARATYIQPYPTASTSGHQMQASGWTSGNPPPSANHGVRPSFGVASQGPALRRDESQNASSSSIPSVSTWSLPANVGQPPHPHTAPQAHEVPEYMRGHWDNWVKTYGEPAAVEIMKKYYELLKRKSGAADARTTTSSPSVISAHPQPYTAQGHIPATAAGAQSSMKPTAAQSAHPRNASVLPPQVLQPAAPSALPVSPPQQPSLTSAQANLAQKISVPRTVPRPTSASSSSKTSPVSQLPTAQQAATAGERTTLPQATYISHYQSAINNLSGQQTGHGYVPHHHYPFAQYSRVAPATQPPQTFQASRASQVSQAQSRNRNQASYTAPEQPSVSLPAAVPSTPPAMTAGPQNTSAATATRPSPAAARSSTLARDILRSLGATFEGSAAGSKRKRSPEPQEAEHSDSSVAKKATQAAPNITSSNASSIPPPVSAPDATIPPRSPSEVGSISSGQLPASPSLSSSVTVPPSREDSDLTDDDSHVGAPTIQETTPREHFGLAESHFPNFQPNAFISHDTLAPIPSGPILLSNLLFPTQSHTPRSPSPPLHAVITAVEDDDDITAVEAEQQDESAVEAAIAREVIDLTADSPVPETPTTDVLPTHQVDATLSADPYMQQPGQLNEAAKALARSPVYKAPVRGEDVPSSAFVTSKRPKNSRAYVLVPPMPEYLRRTKNRVANDSRADGGASSSSEDRKLAKVVRVSNSRLRRRVCEWNGCRKELNSGNSLKAHVSLHGEEERERASRGAFHCHWTLCGVTLDSDSFDAHLERHATSDLYCSYEDCDSHFKHPYALLKHERHAHDEDDMVRLAALPFAPDLPDPLPPLPDTLPSYMSATRAVAKEPIDHDRHMKIGPWVLFRIFGQINLDRLIRNLSARGHNATQSSSGSNVDEYEFLQRMTYSPPEFCDDLVDSHEISRLLHDGVELKVPVQSEDLIVAEAKQEDITPKEDIVPQEDIVPREVTVTKSTEPTAVGSPERRDGTPVSIAVAVTPQSSPFKDANGLFTSMAPPPLFGNQTTETSRLAQDAVDMDVELDDVEKLL